ncbi:MAG: hypothetical protein IT449_15605 [Phycisphaerales bacterium]|nr:hypothetical protein [Phycisphaerales bacterium]
MTAIDETLDVLCNRAGELTAFAWVFRYPDEQKSPTSKEASAWLDLATEVFDAILVRLPEVVAPELAGPDLWSERTDQGP